MDQASSPGQIVILNGAPRSGKSSIVAAIQQEFAGPWMNVGVDSFIALTPARYRPGIGLRPGGERTDIEALVPSFYAAMYESIAAHSRLGLNVVVDVGHHDAYATPRGILFDCARRLVGLPALLVGIRCPIDVILDRRRSEPDKYVSWSPGAPIPLPVQLWQREVHVPGIYDLEVDTSLLAPLECAELIRKHLESDLRPSAIGRLARLHASQT